MGQLGFVLYWALEIYFFAMIGRLFVDLALSVNPSWRPRGPILVLLEVIMTITDPPLKFLSRYIKPLRMGMIQLDFSWTVVVIAIFVLQGIVTNTFR